MLERECIFFIDKDQILPFSWKLSNKKQLDKEDSISDIAFTCFRCDSSDAILDFFVVNSSGRMEANQSMQRKILKGFKQSQKAYHL